MWRARFRGIVYEWLKTSLASHFMHMRFIVGKLLLAGAGKLAKLELIDKTKKFPQLLRKCMRMQTQ
jgi:hypothetical protein